MTFLKENRFTDDELLYLKDLKRASKPVAVALDVIQGEDDVYAGIAIPLIVKTKQKLINIKNDTNASENLKFLATTLENSVEKRFNSVIEDVHMQVATALHPLFKFKFFEKFLPDHVQYIKNKIKNEYHNISETINPQSQSNSNSLSWYSDEDSETQNGSEFDLFFCSNVHLEDLKKREYSNIKTLFLKYNTAMPSSASVERLFRIAKMVLTPERMRISDDNFEAQLLLHQNADFLN